MPLLKRKPHTLEIPPSDLKPDELVFQVRYTKEIFRDYEEYLRQMNLYRRRLWTCKVTGKQNLTYEEALISERRATEKVQQFPKEFMGPVLSMVQCSPLRIDDLVDRIYKEFKDRFVLNEEAFGKSAAESLCPCKILKVHHHVNKEDYHYEVGWLDEHGKKFGTSTEPAANIVRKKHPFTRALLKAFIREAAASGPARNSIWIVKNKLARKFKIPMVSSDNIVAQEPNRLDGTDEDNLFNAEVVEDGARNTTKRRKIEGATSSAQRSETMKKGADVDLPATDAKPIKKSKGLKMGAPKDYKQNSKAKKIAENSTTVDEKLKRPVKKIVKTAAVPAEQPPPPVKYPIEDSLVEPRPDDPPFTVRPLPSTDFVLPMKCVGNVLMVWDFCTSFSKALHLSPFSLEEFEKSLDFREGNAPLVAEVLFALLRTILSDAVLWEEFIKKRKRKSEVTLNTWKEDLSDLLQLTSHERLGPYLASIRQGGYKQLDIAIKLQILQELVDRCLNSQIIRAQLDENIGEHQALSAKKREEEVEGLKLRKQERLKQLPNGTSNGLVEANGKTRDSEIAEEVSLSADDKDHDFLVSKSGVKDENTGEEDGQSVGWKTKGKRKLTGNNSPVHRNGTVKKEDQLDTVTVSKSRQAYLRQKEALKQAEEKEKEKKRSEEHKMLQDRKKGQTDVSAERKSQEQMTLDSQKRQEHLDRELEKRAIRTSPLGKDRDYNVYWFFPREGRIFVENQDSTKWGYYSAKEEFEELFCSLNPRGVREKSLQKQMEKHHQKISNILLRRSKEIAQKIAMEEVAVRRSVRVRSAPRLPVFLAYVNKLRPS